ncbi:hypothetical protein DPMN_176763 [Dreissena polymorpha]|uniref:Uncharacterized protein n=1 Tax=Dreissena polymorpha TaxID=45954 RepID=A0A9D4E7I2_DREPO|nr:hypothetical protein DPMN_176763 [Dreissena polymorpha]
MIDSNIDNLQHIDEILLPFTEHLSITDSPAAYTSGHTAVVAGSVVGGVCFIAGCMIITLLVMKKGYIDVFICT